MLEGEKNNLQAHTRKKKFIVNQGVKKIFHDQTKSPPPPPSEVKWGFNNFRLRANITLKITE